MERNAFASSGAYYTFDIPALKRRIAYLRKNLPESVDLCYAVKANTFIAGDIADEIDRFEICSPGESLICDRSGISADKTVISGVYKSPEHIESLVKAGGGRIYTAESPRQFDLLLALSQKYDSTIPVLLRITNDSQFGMEQADIEKIISERKSHKNIDILGIQFFSGTQKTSLKKLNRELKMLDEFIARLYEEYRFTVRELEYGTGFPVSYFTEDEFDEDEFLRGFSELLANLNTDAKITLELGRSIAASCGCYYTDIVDIKHNKGQNYVLIDGGMHQLVYYGQQMAMRVPIFSVCGKEDAPAVDRYNICGALCSMNDIILKNASLPKIEIGDVLRFENVGAYSPTEGIALFLSRELPAIYISDGENAVCVREPFETYTLNTPHYPAEL